MALYRCAACGSQNVMTDTQTGGIAYNYKKGAIGTVVLGVGGAAAGIEGKTQTVYKCQDCGITLTYTMPEELKNAIDRGLNSESARASLYMDDGRTLSWSILKKQYKNIGEGLVDRVFAERATASREGLLSYATSTKEDFDKAIDLIVDFERRLSCTATGTIYDRLPPDAFSDTAPMTLVEYFTWQDAINTLIENMAKFLPYPLPKEYRGLHDFRMKEYFLIYLYEKVRETYGHYPEFDVGFSKEFKDYAEGNPFVLHFADKYFQRTWTPFGTVDKLIHYWTPDDFGKITLGLRLRSCPAIITIIYKFEDSYGEEILVSRKVPRYTVKDGRLGFWRESNPHNRTPDATGTMEDYFTIYPKKRSEFNEKVATHKKQLAEKGAVEAKLRASELAVSGNQNKIKEMKSEITRLQNKIFGKKAALAKVAEMEQEIRQIEEKSREIEANASVLKNQLEQTLDEEAFYEQLVKEMDYFIAWRWI